MLIATRRSFLKFSAAGVAAAAARLPLWADSQNKTQLWVTSKEKRFAPVETSAMRQPATKSFGSIHVDVDQRRQDILGFGAAFTDASCYLLSRMGQPNQDALLKELLGPTGLRFSVARTCIGASDY